MPVSETGWARFAKALEGLEPAPPSNLAKSYTEEHLETGLHKAAKESVDALRSHNPEAAVLYSTTAMNLALALKAIQ